MVELLGVVVPNRLVWAAAIGLSVGLAIRALGVEGARERVSRLGAVGVLVLTGLHVAAVRAATTHDLAPLGVAGIGVTAFLAFMLITNDGVPWVVNLLAQDAAILFGFAAALWFATIGWFPLVDVLGMALGPTHALAAAIGTVAVLSDRGVVDVEVV